MEIYDRMIVYDMKYDANMIIFRERVYKICIEFNICTKKTF